MPAQPDCHALDERFQQTRLEASGMASIYAYFLESERQIDGERAGNRSGPYYLPLVSGRSGWWQETAAGDEYLEFEPEIGVTREGELVYSEREPTEEGEAGPRTLSTLTLQNLLAFRPGPDETIQSREDGSHLIDLLEASMSDLQQEAAAYRQGEEDYEAARARDEDAHGPTPRL
jgi:hypothetical protein